MNINDFTPYNTPEKCAKWLVEYFIAENEEDYEPQRRWCLLLFESAILIMKANGIASVTACGQSYEIGQLADMAAHAAAAERR